MRHTTTPKPAPTPLLADVLDLETPRARAIATAIEAYPAGIRHDKAVTALHARREELAVALDAYVERYGPCGVTLDRVAANDEVTVELKVLAVAALTELVATA